MQIVFHGATQTVTGSCHEVRVAGKTLLLDCGLFQGPRQLAYDTNSAFDFDPAKVDLVVLSHAHVDHCGKLPVLIKRGFQGPIYATPATIALTAWMLQDGAKIQNETAGHLKKNFAGPNPPPPTFDPLFSYEDAQETIKRFRPIGYDAPTDLGGFKVTLRDAGHLLGSATVRVTEAPDTAAERVLVFSGDIGRPASVVLRDPNPFTHAHAFISECTHGGRVHPPTDQLKSLLTQIINETIHRGGIVIIPAFAMGRTQTLQYLLHELVQSGDVPRDLPVFVDSPLANHLTDVFRAYDGIMDDEARSLVRPFDFPSLRVVGSPEESKALNSRKDPCVIIASSGMCESGRVLHHLKHHVADPRCTVLLAGYQAAQTLGRKLQDGMSPVPILNDWIPRRCRVERLDGLSSHADESELMAFSRPLAKDGMAPPVFLVHGELDSARAHQGQLQEAGFKTIRVPARGDVAEV